MSDLAQRATLSDRAGSMYGYARTNRPDIDVEPQHRALREVGVREEAIFCQRRSNLDPLAPVES